MYCPKESYLFLLFQFNFVKNSTLMLKKLNLNHTCCKLWYTFSDTLLRKKQKYLKTGSDEKKWCIYVFARVGLKRQYNLFSLCLILFCLNFGSDVTKQQHLSCFWVANECTSCHCVYVYNHDQQNAHNKCHVTTEVQGFLIFVVCLF